MRDGSVVCWNGRDSNGPASAVVPGVKGAIQVATSLGTSCAVTRDHRLLCWGRNERGQLGIGNAAPIASGAVVEPTLTR
jgi:hypothetical protein